MARPRLPQLKAETSGAVMKNAGRFKGRSSPKRTRPVGAPYATMTDGERAYWDELTSELPWLHSGHRVLLRIACRLSARLDEGDVGVDAMKALGAILSKLGATPTDETKVSHPVEKDEDPADEFFGKRPN